MKWRDARKRPKFMKEVNRMLHLRKKQNKRKRMARLLQTLYRAAPREEIDLIVLRANGFSDQEIAKKLDERGIHISRRAVAKYREEMQIRGSFERKSFS